MNDRLHLHSPAINKVLSPAVETKFQLLDWRACLAGDQIWPSHSSTEQNRKPERNMWPENADTTEPLVKHVVFHYGKKSTLSEADNQFSTIYRTRKVC
jgi:hypothetical protein